ncbi:MAG: hypothetical protein IJ198_02860 [Lachnospiraceae bacterium]|nr:hypothetical protein [Lachnospiraceae bacterium]
MGGDLNEVVDIRSGLAYLLVKWKIIAFVMLAGVLIGAFYGNRKGAQTQNTAAAGYEETLQNARAACSERGALYAEQLSVQYKAYNSELSRWGAYLNSSVLQNMDPGSYVKKDIQYLLVSESGNVADAFSEALLRDSDLQAISEILGVDPLTASVEELIAVSGEEEGTGIAAQTGEETAPAGGTSASNGSDRKIVTVSIAAGNEEQAQSIGAVVESAVEEKCRKMQAGGAVLQMKKVDERTVRGDSGWLLKRQQSALDRLVTFQINYSLFVKNTTDILQGAQRTYYNLLISPAPEKAAAGSVNKSSRGAAVKYAAAGGAAGLVIAALCIYLLFVFSGRIRTGEELFNNYGLSVLQKFRTGAVPGWDVIRKCGFSCMGMDRAAKITKDGAAPLYAELEKKMAGAQNRQVYLTCDCAQKKARQNIAALAETLTDERIKVIAGDPRDSEKDRKELLESGLVVMAEVLGESNKKDFLDLLAICRRNELPVLGCVTILDTERL